MPALNGSARDGAYWSPESLVPWALVPHAQAQPAKRDKRSSKLSSTAIYRSQAFAAVVSNLHVEFLLKYNAVNQLITE